MAPARCCYQNKVKIQMAVTDERMSREPEWLNFHLLPFCAGKLQLYGHLHGQEEQVVNVFQGYVERASL